MAALTLSKPNPPPPTRLASRLFRFASPARHFAASPFITANPLTVPELTASDLRDASRGCHVCNVSDRLQQHGILKINLRFPDVKSQYLTQLVLSLHQNHGHQLPISHSASRGWFWDVRPSETAFQTANHRARSETMDEFPWHTDCSYEDLPPRYFALQVLQHDRLGGGTLSVMNIQRLSESLSPSTRTSLMRREYKIVIPLEFIKDPKIRSTVGSLMAAGQGGNHSMMRYRRDLLTPLTERARRALDELDNSLQDASVQSQATMHLTSGDLPTGSIILMDNRRWLHSRNDIKDPERHLRRVRWDAIPFPGATTN